MKLIKYLFLFCLLTGLAESTAAQRAIPPADSVLAWRPVNNLRVWTYTFQAKDMGRLVSFVDGVESVNGRTAVRINREFNIDYRLLNEPRTLSAVGQSFVSSRGFYLGDHLQVATDSISEQLEFEVDGEFVEGFFTRRGQEIDQKIAWPREYYAWDPNLLDQLELFLAMRSIEVGGTFADSIFQPQSMLFTSIAGYCDDFRYLELYRGKFDSVFTIRLTAPTPMDLYFTADRELVRADFLTQRIRAYQDVNSLAQPNTASRPQVVSSRWSVYRFVQYLVFAVIGLVGVFFFSRAFYRYLESYIALIAGAAAFFLTLVTQVPLQEWLLGTTQTSESLSLVVFLAPAAAGAVIQELLKLIALALVLRFLRPQPGRSVVVGALVGAMFGIVEACWLAGFGQQSLEFWTVLNAGAMILFHVTAGVLIGASVTGGAKRWLSMWGVIVIVHFVLRVLPALAFTGQLDDPLVALIVATLVLIQAVVTLRFNARQSGRPS